MGDTVTITLTHKQAKALCAEISDWGCWSAGFEYGFKAGSEFDSSTFRPSLSNLRDLNIKLKSAMNDGEVGRVK